MALRERLANRHRPVAVFKLRVNDDTPARARLAEALASDDQAAIAAAKAAVDGCYENLTITAHIPTDWEKLVAQHPPTEAQQKNGQWCNLDTFTPALLAACIEGEETEDDWADYTTKGPLSWGEVTALTNTVFALNQRVPEPWYPKDSTTTVS